MLDIGIGRGKTRVAIEVMRRREFMIVYHEIEKEF